MQLESLKVFCDMARHRSFSRAALANQISQSAVSQIVNQIEKRLGVLLVDRSRRPPRLTRPGLAYYDGCRKLVESYLGMEASIRNLDTEIASSVRVAAIYSVGLRDMNRVLENFRRRNPKAEASIEYLHPDRVYERVLTGAADFGVISFPRASRKLEAIPWREEEMVLACAPSHPLSARRAVRLAQIAGEKFVGFDRGLEIRRQVDRCLRGRGVSVNGVLEFDNIEYIKDAVEEGAGVALLPRPTLLREIEAGTLAAVPLSDVRFIRPLGIIHRRNPKPGAPAQKLIELFRQPDEPALRRRGGSAAGR